ncbi:LysR family transcriptional regulator [Spirochaeta isovalerica]|uniref:DNA-binding transcriptional LysR family regulator n=1 Tax=Spirochaeta isovalerica TaxID=150 RepID=A0A841RBZ1_9SPIO|nr:LysR family transcriptional regulator [Spirochaeta isovalerica]MBB6481495.1 DNA-binding transcriptional LysR family regulator [Spirochaeta isovalerica]
MLMFQSWDRLRVFYYVYSEKSITGASEKLNVTQSAVSQNIQKLESDLKSSLFTRLHKKLVPTAAAERLFELTESFMNGLKIYNRELLQSKEYPFGEIRIGAPAEFGKTYLSLIMADFRTKYPDVTFSIKFGKPETLLPLLKDGNIDFVLLDEFLTDKTDREITDYLHFEPVAWEKVILACSRKYYDTKLKGDVSFSSLSRQNYICYDEEMSLVRHWFENHFPKKKVKLNRVLTVDNHEAVASSILNHCGLGVLSSHLVKKEVDAGNLVAVETGSEGIINTISLVQLMDKIPTLTEKTFSLFLIESIRAMLSHQNLDE